MSYMSGMLDGIVVDLKKRIPLDEIEESKYFHQIEEIGKKHGVCIVLSKLKNFVPFYICPKGMKQIGIKVDFSKNLFGSGMSFFYQLMHLDHAHTITSGINHFLNTPDDDFVMAYHINTTNGCKWAYAASRTLTKEKGNAGYIITIVKMVEDILKKEEGIETKVLPSVTRLEKEKFELLSEREKELIHYISLGKTNSEIGTDMNISVHTVKSHRKNIMRKLDIHNTVELIRFAILSGYFQ